MSYLEELQYEDDANEGIKEAFAEVAEYLAYLWRQGDGKGGAVYQIMVQTLRDEGYNVPSSLEIEPSIPSKKAKIGSRLRKQVFERDMYRCKHCETHLDLSVDHIIPESKGGPTELDNLQTLCRSCNSRKGVKCEVVA